MWPHNGWNCLIKTLKGVLQVCTKLTVQKYFWASDLREPLICYTFSALRRSRKRVQAVIQTEFPCLISKEFASNQENDPCSTNSSSIGQCDKSTVTAHHARWRALFDQMDKALSEEESQLVSFLAI